MIYHRILCLMIVLHLAAYPMEKINREAYQNLLIQCCDLPDELQKAINDRADPRALFSHVKHFTEITYEEYKKHRVIPITALGVNTSIKDKELADMYRIRINKSTKCGVCGKIIDCDKKACDHHAQMIAAIETKSRIFHKLQRNIYFASNISITECDISMGNHTIFSVYTLYDKSKKYTMKRLVIPSPQNNYTSMIAWPQALGTEVFKDRESIKRYNTSRAYYQGFLYTLLEMRQIYTLLCKARRYEHFETKDYRIPLHVLKKFHHPSFAYGRDFFITHETPKFLRTITKMRNKFLGQLRLLANHPNKALQRIAFQTLSDPSIFPTNVTGSTEVQKILKTAEAIKSKNS